MLTVYSKFQNFRGHCRVCNGTRHKKNEGPLHLACTVSLHLFFLVPMAISGKHLPFPFGTSTMCKTPRVCDKSMKVPV
jgi:hypothetical protein